MTDDNVSQTTIVSLDGGVDLAAKSRNIARRPREAKLLVMVRELIAYGADLLKFDRLAHAVATAELGCRVDVKALFDARKVRATGSAVCRL